jgi:hypothetical protein
VVRDELCLAVRATAAREVQAKSVLTVASVRRVNPRARGDVGRGGRSLSDADGDGGCGWSVLVGRE